MSRPLVEARGVSRPPVESPAGWRARVDACDWGRIEAELDGCGGAPIGPLLHPPETDELVGLYDDHARFRSTVDMAAHRYGEGSYRYFAHPLPEAVRALREALYPRLVPVARDWWARLGRAAPWPWGTVRTVGRDCARGRCSTSTSSPPVWSTPGRVRLITTWRGNTASP